MLAKFFRKIVPAKPGIPRVSFIADETLPQDVFVDTIPHREPIVDFMDPFIQQARMRINVLRSGDVLPHSAARKLTRVEQRIDNFQRMVTSPTGLDLDLSILTVAEIIGSITLELVEVGNELGLIDA